ncbi:4-alpha-glucanotransferase [Streptomyces sp. NRRL B-1677]|uniref:4-alpha-glucanotransferase n=1 Tax=Streptomyces klenkii TaxID=1420899 RepID=A0A3B0AW29_9ACTN|nr:MULTISPECIES: 4-alpha-glucanotransferase [Streptomyces]MBF6049380.1 4-alpha-glucanotransferase [Streptomyces sp. NRRL B-1677]RKN64167.1 4-alpha-glucanotransferase [Streptomyces klenkii]
MADVLTARARLAALHGIATSYGPAPGRSVEVPEDTVVAVLAALGVDAATPAAAREALAAHEEAARRRLLPATVVLRAGRGALPALPPGTEASVETEDGAVLVLDAARPPAALPPGTHLLRAHAPDGRTAAAPLIVAPGRLPAPPARGHGFLLQLYSLLSARSWGMGDLGDLAALATWSASSFGTDFVQVNPLHAAVPGAGGTPTDPSPYRPSSRRFPDPVHLRVTDVPEFALLTGEARERAGLLLGRAAALRDAVLHKGELIDRDAAWELKRRALELVRTVPLAPARRAAYEAFVAEQGRALEDHCTWNALAELHGPHWRSWPGGLADPRSAATARARDRLAGRVGFHRWLAWLTDEQLAAAQRAARAAGMRIGLVHDLAVGVHPSGADTWAQQDAFAAGMSVGAPPDAFSPRGQDWGLPPWRPDALEACGYRPYRETLRGLLRHAGGLRVDHVMGLFRLWWVPEGEEPTRGTYVRYDPEAMLGVLALEAHRAGATVVGEDLGTVEPGVREELAERGVLGTSVLWFERDWASAAAAPLPPGRWRAGCLATATTHDLPSTAARLSGDHVGLRHRLGLLARPLADEQREDAREAAEWLELFARLGLLPEGPYGEEAAVLAVHRFLLRTPARLVGVWLPDAVGDRRPQNVPGTWDEYPNWRLPVAGPDARPLSLEELMASPRLRALMAEVGAAGEP